jgi:murein DD-endopeptidase MepM/ murein hydrolase activator NlpD
MEIISYVGTSPSPRRIRRLKIAVPSFSFAYIANILKASRRRLWLVPLAVICAAVPFTVRNVADYFAGYTGPVNLEKLPDTELEILNKAMAQFALDTSDSYDENGNVLNEDGSVVKTAVPVFRDKVTFHTYTVKSGDTVSGITRRAGLTNISTLIGVNDIGNVRQLRSGQKLRIPSTDGLVYTVKSGDTLGGISARYKVTLEDLLDVNDLASQVLAVGQSLFIPGARLDSKTLRQAMGDLFKYPIYGSWRLTSPFGWRPDPFTGTRSFHTGIDMAVPQGTPIHAAMSGKIVFVGYSNVFGNYVIINHGNGYQTLYAHMLKTLAHKGQWVSQGTKLGLVGTTGYSTGPHLHFTVYKNGKLINPLTVLK